MEERSVFALDADKRNITRALRYALIIGIAVAGVVLGLLATASGNTQLFERHYSLLLWLNVAIAAMLLVLVIELARRLAQRFRQGIFGTRLMARLAASFSLMTVIPGLLIYLIASQFLGRSVDSWFSVPVEKALSAGINLSRAALDAQLNELSFRARRLELEISDVPLAQLGSALSRAREQAGIAEVSILTQSGRVLAASTSQLSQLLPDLPSSSQLQQAAVTRQYAAIETVEASATVPPERAMKLRVIRQILAGAVTEEQRYLHVVQLVSSRVAENAEAIRLGDRDYQELSVARQGLKKIFSVTLTLTLLLTLFSAVAAAFLLAGWLTGPLTMLAAGTQAVSEGDFRQVKDYANRDELGVLTQSFNRMTRQLRDARSEVESNQRDIERANAFLQSVLTNMIAGVLAFDAQWRLMLANPGADKIVGQSCQGFAGASIETLPVIGVLADQIRQSFAKLEAQETSAWQQQLSVDGIAGQDKRTLLIQGARLGLGNEPGYLMVFDDVSPVVEAQRALAWSEVAQRLAHEIKNPLTPIQLAAERLDAKLSPHLQGEDAELLHRNARTIVNQVSALKQMVDEFRDYARLPTARLAPLDLNALATEVAQLYSSGQLLGAELRGIDYRYELAPDLPLIQGDPTQLRQLLHNLLKNAREAAESVPREFSQVNQTNDTAHVVAPRALVQLSTEVVRNAQGEVRAVRLKVRDNGPGFSSAVLARAFEPYVTSKVKGTGLGLAIVRKIVDEHSAKIELSNLQDETSKTQGAQVNILFTLLWQNSYESAVQ